MRQSSRSCGINAVGSGCGCTAPDAQQLSVAASTSTTTMRFHQSAVPWFQGLDSHNKCATQLLSGTQQRALCSIGACELHVHKVCLRGCAKRPPLEDVTAALELAQHQGQVFGSKAKDGHPHIVRGGCSLYAQKAPTGCLAGLLHMRSSAAAAAATGRAHVHVCTHIHVGTGRPGSWALGVIGVMCSAGQYTDGQVCWYVCCTCQHHEAGGQVVLWGIELSHGLRSHITAPIMSVSCSRVMGGGRGGVVSVWPTEPGGVTLRRAVEMDPEAPSRRGLWMERGVRNSGGCSLGSVNSSGGNSGLRAAITLAVRRGNHTAASTCAAHCWSGLLQQIKEVYASTQMQVGARRVDCGSLHSRPRASSSNRCEAHAADASIAHREPVREAAVVSLTIVRSSERGMMCRARAESCLCLLECQQSCRHSQ